MNKVQMYISLDVCRPGLQETVYVTGGDQASRELCISLNVGGVPLDMQSGEVTAAYYSMINNSPVLGECRLEGGRIIHELTATECANTHIANIRVQDADGAVLYSPQLQVVSSAPIYSDRALSQSDELSALTKALADTMKSQVAGITESAANGVHTYTVTFGDNSTRTFTVQDGAAGPQGIPGTDGKDGAPGADGAPGKNGTDGRGINTAWVNDNGELQLEYSDGEEDNLGNVKGPRGAKGVKSFIISSGHPSSSLWAREGMRRIKMMSEEDQAAINDALERNDFTGEAYLKAVDNYMDRYCNYWREDLPECCTRPKKSGGEAYLYGWGPNEFVPSGTLKDFEYIDRLHEIKVPSLIMSGISDLCSPLVAKTMADEIPDTKWILWERARHTTFVDRHDDYCVELIKWMNEYDK